MPPSQPPRKGPGAQHRPTDPDVRPRADLDFFTNTSDPGLFPQPQVQAQHISGENPIPAEVPITPDKTKILFTLRDVVMVLAGLISVLSTYFVFKYSVAEAQERAQAAVKSSAEAITTAATIEKRVNRHDTDLAVVEKKVEAVVQDLDRRFADVKDNQKESEKRILDAVRDLRQEVRKK